MMDINEVVTLDDLTKFLKEHHLAMTLHGAYGRFMVTLTVDGGRSLTGEDENVEVALKKAWAQH